MAISEDAILSVSFNGEHNQTEGIFDESPSDHGELTPSGDVHLSDVEYQFEPTSSSFDGSGDRWLLGDSPDWDIWLTSNQNISMSFFFRFNVINQSMGFIGQLQDSNNNWRFYWEYSVGKLWVQTNKPFQNPSWGAHWQPVADQWYHIMFSLDVNQDSYFFVDGVQQTNTTVGKKDWSGGITGALQIGYNPRNYHWANGYMDDIYIERVATTSNFTPPDEPHGGPFTPPPPPGVDELVAATHRNIVVPNRKIIRTNPGFSVTPGMHIPVPIKIDKWHSINTPPVRKKKVNPANTTQVAYVDFSIPTLPIIYPDKWLSKIAIPVREKVFYRPSEFVVSHIEALNPIDGNYFDSGAVGIVVTAENLEDQTYADTGEVSFDVTGEHLEDFQLEDTGAVTFTISNPQVGNEIFNSGVPGFVAASVFIDGVNESEFVGGTISVTREDSTAARFKLFLEEDPDGEARKPVQLVNKIITIAFASADMDGVVADFVPIFVGIIKHVSFAEDQRTLNLGGYDYSGIHQTPGEFVSANITTVFEGSVGASASGTIHTGHSPIWGIVWNGNASVIDSEDYFVDTENGKIVIPISSRILQFPGSFTYNYASPFDTMKDIIQGVASQKGWLLQEDGVVIEDYTTQKAQPVLSLSNESVIDTCRKFLELSGAKVEGNLYPNLRVYSDFHNWCYPENILTLDEDMIFENSLHFMINFDGLLTEQTVRSVQKVNADIVIGDLEVIASFEGSNQSVNPFTIQGGSNINGLDYQTPTVLAEHRIRKTNISSISFTSSGRFFLDYYYNSYSESISAGSWNWFIDGEDFVIQLKHNIVQAGGVTTSGGFQSGFSVVTAFPAVEYTLSVLGTKINYSGGTPEDVRVVTAQRPVSGITVDLIGDVYENPYIETDTHCANICNAVLLEQGNPYTAQFEIPLFEGKHAQIGQRVDIKRGSDIIFSGIIKLLNYSLNLDNGINRIIVRANGIGRGI